MLANIVTEWVARIQAGGRLTEAEALRILQAKSADLGWVLAGAQQLRHYYRGSQVGLCRIVNAKSGRCSEDCRFCAQSAHYQTDAPVFALKSADEMVADARRAAAEGACCFGIVTSGSRVAPGAELDRVLAALREIRRTTDLAPAASLGLLDETTALALAEAGCVTYHHNLETARSFYPQICTTHDYQEDVDTVRLARQAGMRVCCGGLFGLGESLAQRVELGLTLAELGVDSVPINFLNPIPGTPLAGQPRLAPMEGLRIVALFRYLLPRAHITVCGGRSSSLRDYQSWAFLAGASGMMVGDYLTTPGRVLEDDLRMVTDGELTYEPN
jgi:biotin synthase